MFDTYHNAPFQLKVTLFMFVLDYPGIGKVLDVMGSGFVRCEISFSALLMSAGHRSGKVDPALTFETFKENLLKGNRRKS